MKFSLYSSPIPVVFAE